MMKTQPHFCYVCGPAPSSKVAEGTDFQYKTTSVKFEWKICGSCGHHFIDPIPSPKSLEIIYPPNLGNYEEFDKNPGLAFKIKSLLDQKSIKKFLSKKDGARLLDVGCASGRLLDTFKRNFLNYSELHGIELSKSAGKIAIGKGYKVFITTIEEAELEDNFYDTIILQQVIEHVHEPREVVNKLYKKLRPGGKLVLETPALNTWDHKLFRRGAWEGYHIPRHFNLWTEKGMIEELKTAGFSNIELEYKIKPVHWTLSIQNVLRRKNIFAWLDKRLKMNASFPIEICFFAVVDLLQLWLTKRASDAQYIATK